jgi:hypothetical protein
MDTIKNIIVFIALWVFSYFVVDSIDGRRIFFNEAARIDHQINLWIFGLAMAILIAYVWNRLFKKINRK